MPLEVYLLDIHHGDQGRGSSVVTSISSSLQTPNLMFFKNERSVLPENYHKGSEKHIVLSDDSAATVANRVGWDASFCGSLSSLCANPNAPHEENTPRPARGEPSPKKMPNSNPCSQPWGTRPNLTHTRETYGTLLLSVDRTQCAA